MAYIGNSPTNIQRGRRAQYHFTASVGQTAFTGTDDNGLTLDLLESVENDVYFNGARLILDDDYTISGDTLTLTAGAAAGDILVIVTQDDIVNLNSYTKAEADGRYINYDGDIINGDIQVVGNIDATSLATTANITMGNDTSALLSIKGGSTTSPQIRFFDGGVARARVGVPTGTTYLSLSGSDTLTPDVVVNSSGNVGIGTTSPTDDLHIGSSSGGTQVKIESGSGTNSALLYRTGGVDSWRIGMNLTATDGSLQVYNDVTNVSNIIVKNASTAIGQNPSSANVSGWTNYLTVDSSHASEGAPSLELVGNRSGSAAVGVIQGINKSSNGTFEVAKIQMNSFGTTGQGAIYFYTGGSVQLSIDHYGRLRTYADLGNSDDFSLILGREDGTTSSGAREHGIGFWDQNNGTYTGAVTSYRSAPSGHYNGGLKFYVNNTGGANATNLASLTEVMTLTEDKKVGINGASGADLSVKTYSTSRDGTIRVGGGNGIGENRVFIQSAEDVSDTSCSYIDSYGDDEYQSLQINASVVRLARQNSPNLGRVTIGNVASYANSNLTIGGELGSYSSTIFFDNNTTGGGEGFILTTDDTWNIKTQAGQAGMAIGTSVPSSANVRIHIANDGTITMGKNIYSYVGNSGDSGTNVHVPGPISIGHGNTGEHKKGGRRVLGWYAIGYHSSGSYTHLETDLWGGGSPYGNSEYIMGGFEIRGYRYASPGHSHEMIGFHNWSGGMSAYNVASMGNWTAGCIAYVGSNGYVHVRVPNSQYYGFNIDLYQYNWYPVRNINVVAVHQNSTANM